MRLASPLLIRIALQTLVGSQVLRRNAKNTVAPVFLGFFGVDPALNRSSACRPFFLNVTRADMLAISCGVRCDAMNTFPPEPPGCPCPSSASPGPPTGGAKPSDKVGFRTFVGTCVGGGFKGGVFKEHVIASCVCVATVLFAMLFLAKSSMLKPPPTQVVNLGDGCD